MHITILKGSFGLLSKQVVRATSAAPSMFAELNWNRLRFQDGGLMANNVSGTRNERSLLLDHKIIMARV